MIIRGDCLEELKKMKDNSIDAIITDPPYELGFMGKHWDNSGITYNVELWKECLRVLKHGGHLLAFSGTRTYHRMACAIEDAGFEVRDMIEWVYGSGFPKSLNIGKAVDKIQGNHRKVIGINNNEKDFRDLGVKTKEIHGLDKLGVGVSCERKQIEITKGNSEWEGWGTALKPAHEPICMARKPLSEKTVVENCLKWGTGGINIDESRIGTEPIRCSNDIRSLQKWKELDGRKHKELFNPEPTYNNGRFPANLIHDNSEEVRECFPESSGGKFSKGSVRKTLSEDNGFKLGFLDGESIGNAPDNYGDSGNASRFFKSIVYIPKASKSERNRGCEGLELKNNDVHDNPNRMFQAETGVEMNTSTRQPNQNNHPTVKPVALMEYLIKMVTKENQVVLDMFLGSGTTAVACLKTNRRFIGIEKEEEYVKIAEARLKPFLTQQKLLESEVRK